MWRPRKPTPTQAGTPTPGATESRTGGSHTTPIAPTSRSPIQTRNRGAAEPEPEPVPVPVPVVTPRYDAHGRLLHFTKSQIIDDATLAEWDERLERDRRFGEPFDRSRYLV